MPTVLVLLFVALLVGFSALCSGLNIGIMALDLGDLRRKAKLGNRAAQRVLPLRRKVHLTLASILLSNVATISGTSLVLGNRFNGAVAEIASTLLIVVFGEVLPQAFFAHHALRFCAALSPLLRAMVVITYPVSRPLEWLLDTLFGDDDAPRLQTRHELGLMIAEHAGSQASELDEDEIEIMRGALTLSEKRARDIMTDMREVFWLTPDTPLNRAGLDEIKARAWSRIPVFNRRLSVCYGIVLMKDLVDLDFQAISRVDDLPLHPCQTVGSMTALDTMFRKFIHGGTHLLPVERDDRIVGIVTIEDLLEEIVGREIEDETDRLRRPHPFRRRRVSR